MPKTFSSDIDELSSPSGSEPSTPPPDPAPAEGADKASPEAWAERKGMLPQMIDGPGGRQRLNPDYWKFAGAKAFMGAEVTEKEFDEAVARHPTEIIR